VVETDSPAFAYRPAEQAADGLVLPLVVRVAQLGTSAASRDAILTLS
jgi:hypothetical protein